MANFVNLSFLLLLLHFIFIFNQDHQNPKKLTLDASCAHLIAARSSNLNEYPTTDANCIRTCRDPIDGLKLDFIDHQWRHSLEHNELHLTDFRCHYRVASLPRQLQTVPISALIGSGIQYQRLPAPPCAAATFLAMYISCLR